MGKNRMRIKGIFPMAEGTVEGFGKPVRRQIGSEMEADG